METIILSPIHETFFSGRLWMGLDMGRIKLKLESEHGYSVSIIDFSIIASDYNLLPPNSGLFYTVSYNENYNRYIRDVIVDLAQSRKDIILLPDLNQLFAFENKGFQELYKKRLGISNVKGAYWGDNEDFIRFTKYPTYPLVIKSLNGSVSSGVRLINNLKGFDSYFRKAKRHTLLDLFRICRRQLYKRKANLELYQVEKYVAANYEKFFAPRSPFVAQEFIEGLNCDYKVLIFGKKYYVFQRKVRDNDFRASGSGKFAWIEPPLRMLDYARELKNTMNVPFISLDIADTTTHCALLEFQGIGFGPIGLTGSSFYYEYIGSAWKKINMISNLDDEYANSIHDYLLDCTHENYKANYIP